MKIFVRLLLICVFVLFNTSLRPACLSPSGTDVTNEFSNLYQSTIDNQSDDFKKNIERLREYTILLIPGIDFDLMEELYYGDWFQYLRRKLFQLFERRGHLQDYKDFFDENNVKYKTLKVNDDRYFKQTDKITRIINLIKSTQENIIVVAHSKGGVDVQTILLHFLNSNIPEDRYELAKIKGAIFLQVPFQGSPLADLYIKGQSFFSRPVKYLLRTCFRRNSEHVEAFSLARRQSFNEKNKISLYYGEERYILENSSEILRRATETLQILEKQKENFDDSLMHLNVLEITNLATTMDICNILQKMEMIRREAEMVKRYLVELGKEGIIVSMRLKELTKDFAKERDLILMDYFGVGLNKAETTLCGMNFDFLLDTGNISRLLFEELHDKPISPELNNLQKYHYRYLTT